MHQSNMDKKAINPIFSSIFLYSDGEKLKIVSTDGQKSLEHILNENFEKFDYFLNGVSLYEILKKSKNETFNIQETYENYKIQVGTAEFKFAKQILPKGEFNPLNSSEYNYKYNFTCSANLIANAIKLVKWSAASDDSRPFLNGVCIEMKDGYLNFCATDGLRLAFQRIQVKYEFEQKCILGKKSVYDFVKFLEEIGDEEIQFYFGDALMCVFEKGDKKVVWQSIFVAGNFPEYQKVIPESFVSSYVAESKEIQEVVDRIMTMANQNQPTIMLKFFETEKSKIFCENSLSSGEDTLPGEYNGKNLQIMLNGRFLQEVLSHVYNKVIFEINDPRSPIVVKNVENNGSLFIIAPVKQG